MRMALRPKGDEPILGDGYFVWEEGPKNFEFIRDSQRIL
jgi:hypothetical protein